MPYSKKDWIRRIAERSDMSSSLVHLTRESEKIPKVVDVLLKILIERRLIGSSTGSGFISGPRRAVCFQDAPLYSICQNTFFEQKAREIDSTEKLRYRAVGLSFSKDYLYKKGARPVIYEKTDVAKAFLPQSEWWRIVRLDLSDEKSFVDWTHEREWRLPGDLEFDLKEVTLLSIKNSTIKVMAEKFREATGLELRDEICGIVTLNNILA